MWINSQDEHHTVNVKCFNQVGKCIEGLFDGNENGGGVIGQYESEERTKEVMKEIVDAIRMEYKVFQMPEE